MDQYLLLPDVNFLSNLLELCPAMFLCSMEDSVKINDPVIDSSGHVLSLGGCLRTLVECGTEPVQEEQRDIK